MGSEKKIKDIESKLEVLEQKVVDSPSRENIEKLDAVKAEYEKEYEYITRGLIVRSRATWYEKGEINSKYFF